MTAPTPEACDCSIVFGPYPGPGCVALPTGEGYARMEYCPLHAAAPAMVLLLDYDTPHPGCTGRFTLPDGRPVRCVRCELDAAIDGVNAEADRRGAVEAERDRLRNADEHLNECIARNSMRLGAPNDAPYNLTGAVTLILAERDRLRGLLGRLLSAHDTGDISDLRSEPTASGREILAEASAALAGTAPVEQGVKDGRRSP